MAECYDHRSYYHPLAVDPVCKGCNNRRGPGFPINPDGDTYTNEVSRKLGSVGHKWSALDGGVSEQYSNGSQRTLLHNMPEKSVRDFIDEHWVTWEIDKDLRKYTQECSMAKKKSMWFAKSFERGLYDWFGVAPV
jgi:hypothetical protein